MYVSVPVQLVNVDEARTFLNCMYVYTNNYVKISDNYIHISVNSAHTYTYLFYDFIQINDS